MVLTGKPPYSSLWSVNVCVAISVAVIQLLSLVGLFSTLWTAARQTSLSFAISQSWLKFMSIVAIITNNNNPLCIFCIAF